MNMGPVQCSHSISPVFGERNTFLPLKVKPSALSMRGAYLKSRCEDQAIERVMLAVDDHSIWCHCFNTPPICVDQSCAWFVERIEIIIMKARPFTQLPIPRFEFLCRFFVLNYVFSTPSNFLHLLKVSALPSSPHGLWRPTICWKFGNSCSNPSR